MTNIVMECHNIWKKINHHVIVNDLSFNLYEGDILGFIGPNGAGKTTTIKLILGLQPLNGGIVKINGYDLKKEFTKAIANVGAIVENPDLYMYMSGYENLALVADIYKISATRIDEVVKLVGLEDKIHDKVKKYSLGMRQRLGIAQAILHNPKVLILDEPMNGLDPNGIKELKDLLIKLTRENHLAILISSHILSELENFCNRVCILSKGRLIKDTTIENITQITEQIKYRIEVDNIKLDKILEQYEVLDNNHIRVTTTKKNIDKIIKTLLLNEIAIFELKKETSSLEDMFLKIMKEDNHD